jgi:tetratricopeptide (TPR) repeat protein
VDEKLHDPDLLEVREEARRAALRNADQVADIYSRFTSNEPTTLSGLVELGGIYRQLGQSEKASRQFLKALEIAKERMKIKKGSDPSRRNLAVVYWDLGGFAEKSNRDLNTALDYHRNALALIEDIGSPCSPIRPRPRRWFEPIWRRRTSSSA